MNSLMSGKSVHVSVCVFSCRRKVEIMHTHSLFTLLGERLMMHTNTVSITTYNTLYEVSFSVVFVEGCPFNLVLRCDRRGI